MKAFPQNTVVEGYSSPFTMGDYCQLHHRTRKPTESHKAFIRRFKGYVTLIPHRKLASFKKYEKIRGYLPLFHPRNSLKGFPSPVIDVCLQLATDSGRDVVVQPHISEESVVSFLIQDQLTVSSESRINLAMAVEVWSEVPGAVLVMEIEDRAFADVDEETHVFATPSRVRVSTYYGLERDR
jgi:hypothetical protein